MDYIHKDFYEYPIALESLILSLRELLPSNMIHSPDSDSYIQIGGSRRCQKFVLQLLV